MSNAGLYKLVDGAACTEFLCALLLLRTLPPPTINFDTYNTYIPCYFLNNVPKLNIGGGNKEYTNPFISIISSHV